MSSDGIHLNTSGHTQIASKILSNPLGANDCPVLTRKLLLTGDISTNENLSLDGDYNTIRSMIDAGVDVVAVNEQYGGFIELRPAVNNSYMIQFYGSMSSGQKDCILVILTWFLNGSIMVLGEDILGAVRKAAPRNLLDNSDFRDPVNQRGQASYTDECGIDRWRVWNSDMLTVNSGYITVNGSVFQYFLPPVVQNSVHTLAAKKTDGSILLYTKNPHEVYSMADNGLGLGLDGNVVIRLPTGSYLWAALYEGEYTAETLPEYQPKGYGAELAECQRYYQVRSANNIAAVDMRPTMRLSSPTITSVTGGYAYSADL